jgi:hypothetical protein
MGEEFQNGRKLKKISVEEAEEYVPLKNDMKSDLSHVAFYTATPSKDKEGWEDITYYLPRKKQMYSGRKEDGDSWVYIMSNESFPPNRYKIGYTNKDNINDREKQLSRSTSVPTPFRLEFAFRCFNAERLEGEIHKKLEGYRVSNDREFFDITLREAREIVEDLGQKYI